MLQEMDRLHSLILPKFVENTLEARLMEFAFSPVYNACCKEEGMEKLIRYVDDLIQLQKDGYIIEGRFYRGIGNYLDTLK